MAEPGIPRTQVEWQAEVDRRMRWDQSPATLNPLIDELNAAGFLLLIDWRIPDAEGRRTYEVVPRLPDWHATWAARVLEPQANRCLDALQSLTNNSWASPRMPGALWRYEVEWFPEDALHRAERDRQAEFNRLYLGTFEPLPLWSLDENAHQHADSPPDAGRYRTRFGAPDADCPNPHPPGTFSWLEEQIKRHQRIPHGSVDTRISSHSRDGFCGICGACLVCGEQHPVCAEWRTIRFGQAVGRGLTICAEVAYYHTRAGRKSVARQLRYSRANWRRVGLNIGLIPRLLGFDPTRPRAERPARPSTARPAAENRRGDAGPGD